MHHISHMVRVAITVRGSYIGHPTLKEQDDRGLGSCHASVECHSTHRVVTHSRVSDHYQMDQLRDTISGIWFIPVPTIQLRRYQNIA